MLHKKTQSGQSIIEIMLAIAILAITVIGLATALTNEAVIGEQLLEENQAITVAREGIDATRSIWDRNPLLIAEGTWGLAMTADGWTLSGTEDNPVPNITRTITVSPVYRDGTGAIVDGEPSSDLDPETLRITSTAAWTDNLSARDISFETYLGNWQGEDWILTTRPEWNTGVFDNTVATLTGETPPADDGRVGLATVLNHSGFFSDVDIGHHANDVAVSGNYAYVATDANSAGLAVVDITDIENPIVVATRDVGGKARGIALEGAMVYLAIDKEETQLAIVNISDPNNPVVENTRGWTDEQGRKVAVNYPHIYVTTRNEDAALLVIDASDPANPVLENTLELEESDNGARGVGYYEGHIYLGTHENGAELRILDATTLATVAVMDFPRVIHDIDVDPATNDIFLAIDDHDPGFAIVNVTDPANPVLRGTADLNEKATGVFFDPPNIAYVVTNENNDSLHVIDIQNRAQPIIGTTLDIEQRGVDLFVAPPYVFIAVDTSNEGLVIVGTSEYGFPPTGSYTSPIFDTGGAEPLLKRIEINGATPPDTTLMLQLRTAATSGGIASATFVGPDGTAGTTYDLGMAIPMIAQDASGTRYLQWRATFTSSPTQSSTLDDVRITYLP